MPKLIITATKPIIVPSIARSFSSLGALCAGTWQELPPILGTRRGSRKFPRPRRQAKAHFEARPESSGFREFAPPHPFVGHHSRVNESPGPGSGRGTPRPRGREGGVPLRGEHLR